MFALKYPKISCFISADTLHRQRKLWKKSALQQFSLSSLVRPVNGSSSVCRRARFGLVIMKLRTVFVLRGNGPTCTRYGLTSARGKKAMRAVTLGRSRPFTWRTQRRYSLPSGVGFCTGVDPRVRLRCWRMVVESENNGGVAEHQHWGSTVNHRSPER